MASVSGTFVYTPAVGTVMNDAGTQTLADWDAVTELIQDGSIQFRQSIS
jgi:hypothetical protein